MPAKGERVQVLCSLTDIAEIEMLRAREHRSASAMCAKLISEALETRRQQGFKASEEPHYWEVRENLNLRAEVRARTNGRVNGVEKWDRFPVNTGYNPAPIEQQEPLLF